MPINEALYHQTNFRLTQALGAKLNAGDATFAPVGFDGMYLLVKQFPHPTISGGAEIEVAMAGGGSYWEQQPIETKFTGAITLYETEAGTVKQFAQDVVAAGGYFDVRIYEGTPGRHLRSYLLERCFFKIDPSDRDWENRTQVLMLNGTLYGSFFGRTFPGNA
jgi:hypothetical protein